METLTVTIETELATRARQVAEQRHTTVDSLVSEFLTGLTNETQVSRKQAADRLMSTIEELSRPMEGKRWTDRDDLHDR